jgi:hypothetical protein
MGVAGSVDVGISYGLKRRRQSRPARTASIASARTSARVRVEVNDDADSLREWLSPARAGSVVPAAAGGFADGVTMLRSRTRAAMIMLAFQDDEVFCADTMFSARPMTGSQ